MRARELTGLTVGAGAAWLALGIAIAARWTSPSIPPEAVSALAPVALGLALLAAVRAAAQAWRGPVIRSFASADGVRCDPSDAAVVRAAAQLRGSLGGAGHVHPSRLVLSALAWLAAAGAAGAVFVDPGQAVVLLWGGVALALCAMAMVFPAHAFYYRETSGDGIVLHPPDARSAILQLRGPPTRDGHPAAAAKLERGG